MAITHKFTRALPAPTATHSGGFVFLLSAAWFSQSDLGVAGSPINGVNAFANGGGDMQAFSNAGLPDEQPTGRLPLDIVTFVTGGSPSAEVWLLKDTYTAGDKITLGKDDTQTVQPAVTAPFGRNAVYVNEINRMHMESVAPIDSSGNQNSIIANSVTSETGNIGNALRFNGSSSDIDLGDSILPVGDFTQSVWINPDDLSGFQGIIGNWVSPEDGRSYLGLNGTSYNWDGYDTSTNDRGTATASVWQMLTVTRTGSTVRILKNGVQQGNTITDSGAPNILHNTFIGALGAGTSNFYDGLIGDNFLSDTYRDNNYMLDLFINQSDPDNFGTSSEYIEVTSGGSISITVTETKSSSLNNSNVEISANLSVIVTEVKSPRSESSLLTVSAGGLALTVTEVKSSSIDSAVIDVTSNISALVTEVKSSRADFSAAQIQKDIETIVTEIRTSRVDSSLLNIPVTITISKKNMVRVKREARIVRVKRNNKIIRVR